jgi:hypothetical protein
LIGGVGGFGKIYFSANQPVALPMFFTLAHAAFDAIATALWHCDTDLNQRLRLAKTLFKRGVGANGLERCSCLISSGVTSGKHCGSSLGITS